MFDVCLSIVVGQSAYMPHATGSIECILSNCQQQLKRTFAETVSQLLRVLLVIFRYTAGTRVSTVVAELSFPELWYFYKI